MGRRKIQIAPIQDDRNRNVTFGKRRNGLFKKAYELGVLCQVDIAVMVWSHTGKLHVFSSAGGLKPILDRYAGHGNANIDVTTPKSYGDTSPATIHTADSGKHGGRNSKKRRRDESDDEDEDDDGDDDGEEDGGDPHAQQHDDGNQQNTSGYSSISPPEHQQAVNQMSVPPMPMPGNPGAYAAYQHPMYAGYPGYGYPGMPNVNPALGNAFSQFFQPSQQAAYAAAQAMGGMQPNGHPAQSAFPAPSNYMPFYGQQPQQQQQQQQQPPQPQRYGSQQPGPSDYGQQLRASPQPMEEHQSNGNQSSRSNNHSARRQESTDSYRSSANHPSDLRKPSLQITMPDQPQAPPESNLREDPQPNGNGNESNDNNGQEQGEHAQQQQQQQRQDNNHLLPPDFPGVPFPDSYITSPSQLFPEIYRNFHMQAMAGFDPNSPAAQEEEDNRAFKWPSLNGVSVKEEKVENSREKSEQ